MSDDRSDEQRRDGTQERVALLRFMACYIGAVNFLSSVSIRETAPSHTTNRVCDGLVSLESSLCVWHFFFGFPSVGFAYRNWEAGPSPGGRHRAETWRRSNTPSDGRGNSKLNIKQSGLTIFG